MKGSHNAICLLERGVCLLLLLAIELYKGVSFFLPARCRFYPSCSSYGKTAIVRYGLAGIPLTLRRLMRCHPWNAGGLDPVPPSYPTRSA